MASQNSSTTNSDSSPFTLYLQSKKASSSSLYTTEEHELVEVLVKIPGAILHLIDVQHSIELACGEFQIIRRRQNQNAAAVVAWMSDDVQWQLAKDEAAAKLDDSHYFFSPRVPSTDNGHDSSDEEDGHATKESEDSLNYGLTIASKGQEGLLKELDEILNKYSSFSVQKISNKSLQVLDESMAKGLSPMELKLEKEKEMMRGASAAYWTILAPNVEDYSGSVARMIAKGSAKVIKKVLWCSDITVERLLWGNEFLKNRMAPCAKQLEVSPKTLRRMRRVKKISKMSEKLAMGVFYGVQKISGLVTSPIVNTNVGNKVVGLLQREVARASLDGLGKVSDAMEVAGKNVISATSVVTTELVSHRYGEKVGEVTNEGIDAAGHAVVATWTFFKAVKALNPLKAIKPILIAKSAAAAATEAEAKAKPKGNAMDSIEIAKSTAKVAAVAAKANESALSAVEHVLRNPSPVSPSMLYTVCCVLVGVFLCLVAIQIS